MPGITWAYQQSVDLFKGSGDTGVRVTIGDSNTRFPAKRFACQNCHGKGGQGQTEGATVAPSLLYSELTGASIDRLGYDAATFHRLVTSAVDSGGRSISSIMPRYEVSVQQSKELFDYLGALEVIERSGVQPDRVRVGFEFSDSPTPKERTSFEILRREVELANNAGHAFGRKIELVQLKAVRGTAGHDIFATIGSFHTGGPDDEGSGTHPISIFPNTALASYTESSHSVFHSVSVATQIQNLMAAMMEDGYRRCAIVGDESRASRDLVRQALLVAEVFSTDGKLECTLQDSHAMLPDAAAAVLLLSIDGGILASFGNASNQRGIYGLLDMLADKVPVLKANKQKIRLADPHPGVTAEAISAGKTTREIVLERAVKLIVVGLQRVGRNLTKQRFLSALGDEAVVFSRDDKLDFKMNPATGLTSASIVNF